ncbi:hypothetical protein D3C75_703460 [compost metagenome]
MNAPRITGVFEDPVQRREQLFEDLIDTAPPFRRRKCHDALEQFSDSRLFTAVPALEGTAAGQHKLVSR